jgi:hypothetical protein
MGDAVPTPARPVLLLAARNLLLRPTLHEQALARTCSMAHRKAFSDRIWKRFLFWSANDGSGRQRVADDATRVFGAWKINRNSMRFHAAN